MGASGGLRALGDSQGSWGSREQPLLGCAALFWDKGRRCSFGSGGCIVMGTVPAVLAGNHPLASPPGAELAEAPQEEICGVGALLICRDSRDAPCRPGGRILPGAEPHGDRGLCKFPHCHFALSLCAVRSCGDPPGQRTPISILCPTLSPPRSPGSGGDEVQGRMGSCGGIPVPQSLAGQSPKRQPRASCRAQPGCSEGWECSGAVSPAVSGGAAQPS